MAALTRKAVFQAVREKLPDAKARAALSQKLGKKWSHAGTAAIAQAIGLRSVPTAAPAKGTGKQPTGKAGSPKTAQLASAIAAKTGKPPKAVLGELKQAALGAIGQTRAAATKDGHEATRGELVAAAQAAVTTHAKALMRQPKAPKAEKAPKVAPTPKTAKAELKTEQVKARSIAQKSGVAKTFASDTLARRLAKPGEDAGVIKKGLLKAIDSDLGKAKRKLGRDLTTAEKRQVTAGALKRETTKLRGERAKEEALLSPIDPSGSTESSLDRTEDQRRLRGKASLTHDEIRDAGANLRQGMRGAAGGANNRALLEYSAHVYNRLDDKGKDRFAEEAGKVIHDDLLYKEKRLGSMIVDIKQRHDRLNGVTEKAPKATNPPPSSAAKPSLAANPLATLSSFKEGKDESIIDSRKRRTQEFKQAEEQAKREAAKLPEVGRVAPDQWRSVKATEQDRHDFATSLWGKDRDASPPSVGDILKWQDKAKNPPYVEELMALNLYTKSEYLGINKALRGDESTLSNSSANRDAKVISSMLNQLPDHKGEVYRGFGLRDGLTLDDVEKMYKPGSSIAEKALTSSTTEKPGDQTAFARKPVQFIIQSKTGKKVKDYSHTPSEEEVLFRPDTAFKVHKVERHGDRLLIHIEEQ